LAPCASFKKLASGLAKLSNRDSQNGHLEGHALAEADVRLVDGLDVEAGLAERAQELESIFINQFRPKLTDKT
jgi:hypothetical protein